MGSFAYYRAWSVVNFGNFPSSTLLMIFRSKMRNIKCFPNKCSNPSIGLNRPRACGFCSPFGLVDCFIYLDCEINQMLQGKYNNNKDIQCTTQTIHIISDQYYAKFPLNCHDEINEFLLVCVNCYHCLMSNGDCLLYSSFLSNLMAHLWAINSN